MDVRPSLTPRRLGHPLLGHAQFFGQDLVTPVFDSVLGDDSDHTLFARVAQTLDDAETAGIDQPTHFDEALLSMVVDQGLQAMDSEKSKVAASPRQLTPTQKQPSTGRSTPRQRPGRDHCDRCRTWLKGPAFLGTPIWKFNCQYPVRNARYLCGLSFEGLDYTGYACQSKVRHEDGSLVAGDLADALGTPPARRKHRDGIRTLAAVPGKGRLCDGRTTGISCRDPELAFPESERQAQT